MRLFSHRYAQNQETPRTPVKEEAMHILLVVPIGFVWQNNMVVIISRLPRRPKHGATRREPAQHNMLDVSRAEVRGEVRVLERAGSQAMNEDLVEVREGGLRCGANGLRDVKVRADFQRRHLWGEVGRQFPVGEHRCNPVGSLGVGGGERILVDAEWDNGVDDERGGEPCRLALFDGCAEYVEKRYDSH